MRKFKTFEAAIDELMSTRGEVNHEIIWYIEPRLTMQQWSDLDDAMDEAFEKCGIGTENVIGIAGPIPFEEDSLEGDEELGGEG